MGFSGKLFTKTYPQNIDMDDVLVKVCSLNDFYSTNIFSPFTIAKHIVGLNIDDRLLRKDFSLVNDIAVVQVSKDKHINFYSFATKYCSHHRPEDYPIYDNFVERVLLYFHKRDRFYEFKKNNLKEYLSYRKILLQFAKHYELEAFSLKQIDKYLWQIGKKYFPKQYKGRNK